MEFHVTFDPPEAINRQPSPCPEQHRADSGSGTSARAEAGGRRDHMAGYSFGQAAWTLMDLVEAPLL